MKSGITAQKKNYRIDEEHKQSLLEKLKNFDKLYAQEKFPDPLSISDVARDVVQKQENKIFMEEELQPIDTQIPTEILAASSSPDILSPPVLSTTIHSLWISDTTCQLTLISILKLYTQQYIVYYPTNKRLRSLAEF